MSTFIDSLALIGAVVTLGALALSILQLQQARQQTRSLGHHDVALTEITDALSTRYLGVFPEYLAQVTATVGRATESLVIISGNPTPAYFSFPHLWIEYQHAVAERIIAGIKVELTCMTRARRLNRLRQQFSAVGDYWATWSDEHARQIDYFLSHRYPDQQRSALDQESFLELLVETQYDVTRELFGRAPYEVDSSVTIQVWVADDREAVFTIETLAAHGLSHGLFSSDPRFVRALRALHGYQIT